MRRAAIVLWLLSIAATALAQDGAPLSARWGVAAEAWARRPLPRPLCFGVTRTERAFACVGYAVDGETGARRGYVDVIGLGRRQPLREAIPVVGARAISPDALDARLDAHGIEPIALRRTRLSAGTWTRVGRSELLYDLQTHEGDASFEHLGDLALRCADGREVRLGARDRGLELGGEAWAFRAREGEAIAISVIGEDGGEGVVYRWVNTMVISPRALCGAGGRGIVGPLAGRNVGP